MRLRSKQVQTDGTKLGHRSHMDFTTDLWTMSMQGVTPGYKQACHFSLLTLYCLIQTVIPQESETLTGIPRAMTMEWLVMVVVQDTTRFLGLSLGFTICIGLGPRPWPSSGNHHPVFHWMGPNRLSLQAIIYSYHRVFIKIKDTCGRLWDF